MLKKSTIELTQINAHWCKANGTEEGLLSLWEILSYKKKIKLAGKIKVVQSSFLDRRGNKFPFGLVSYASDKLTAEGFNITINELKVNKETVNFPKLPDIDFEDYQKKAFRYAGRHNNGIFISGTGSGKTIIAGGLISKHNFPVSLVVVINKSIFNQMIQSFEKWFPDIEIGRVGDSECYISHITVALYQSLSKWDLKKYNNELEMIIVDEAHSSGNSITKIMKQLTNVYLRFGLTATPRTEKENKEKFLEMTGNLGPVILEIEDEDVKARVTDVEVHMINYLCLSPKGNDYRSSYKKDILFSPIRNRNLLKKAKELVLDKGKTCLFMVKEIGHAKRIKFFAELMGLKPYIVHSEKDDMFNEWIRKQLEKGNINLVIATQKWGTGTDIKNIDCVVPCSVRKSFIELIQNIGRGRRKTDSKDTLIVIDSYDKVKGKGFFKKFEGYSKYRKEIYEEKGWLKNGKA